jgi:hypothetical protein
MSHWYDSHRERVNRLRYIALRLPRRADQIGQGGQRDANVLEQE